MTILFGLQTEEPNLLCKLEKSLMHLSEQAGNGMPNSLLSSQILAMYSPKLTIHSSVSHPQMVSLPTLVYVDDLVLTRDDISKINAIKKLLDDHLKIKEPG